LKKLNEYDRKRLDDLLHETRVKCNKEKRKLGLNEIKHHIFNKLNESNPNTLINPSDLELEDIVDRLILTYRDQDGKRFKLMSDIVSRYETKISNSKYKIGQFEDTIAILVDKITELEESE